MRIALVDAGASHYGLASSAFTGLGQGTTYYAYDLLQLDLLGRGQLGPEPKFVPGWVVVQDDEPRT